MSEVNEFEDGDTLEQPEEVPSRNETPKDPLENLVRFGECFTEDWRKGSQEVASNLVEKIFQLQSELHAVHFFTISHTHASSFIHIKKMVSLLKR